MYGQGISKVGEILDLGVKLDVCQKSGSWFYYNDMRLGQGRDNAKVFLTDNPDLADEIEEKIRQNADKLSPSRAKAKAAEEKKAAAAASPAASAQAPSAPSAPVPTPARASKKPSVDILVDDE